MIPHRILTRLAVVGFFIASAQALQAARLPIDYDVEAGFGGVVPDSGGLFPVVVTLNNNVASTSGLIEILQPDPSGGAEVKHTLPFTTPAPSIKRFCIIARMEPGRDLELRITFKDQIRPIIKKLKIQKSTKPLVVCAGVQRSVRPGALGESYRVASVSPQSLPADPLAFDGLHALVLSGGAFMSLSKAQLDAVARWTVTGGILVFTDTLPDEVFWRNFQVLAGKSGVKMPSTGYARLGAGFIACSGADPEMGGGPFWSGDDAATGVLFPNLTKEDYFSHSGTGFFTRQWQDRRAYGFMGAFWIILIIGAYVVVIGPVDMWIVRRMKKPYMTWVLFPVSIALFALIAHMYSSLVNVGTMRAIYANIVDVSPGHGLARGNSLFWVHSVKNATYAFATSLKNVCFSARESSLGAGSAAAVDVVNGADSTMSARIPIFSSKTFDASWYMPWPHEIVCRRERTDLQFIVPADLKITTAFLATDEGLTRLDRFGDTWTTGSTPEPWDEAIARRVNSISQYRYNYGYRSGDSDDNDMLPSTDSLQDYLICMSFPTEVSQDKAQKLNSYYSSYYRRERDGREIAMDIQRRLHGGKVLLLFSEQAPGLLPVEIKWSLPSVRRVNLVRYQVPDGV